MSDTKDILTELGTNPISDGQPTGDNIRYDDEFEFVEDELSKQGSMIDRGLVHWDKVIYASSNILSNKSKDLKVSCYLIRALFENRGVQGLQIGLEINHQILNQFWDNLFPVKKRARANAYEWLSSKFIPLLENLEPELDSLTALESSYESIKNIEQFLNEQLLDDAPALGSLRRLINDLIEPLKQLKEIEDKKQIALQLSKNTVDGDVTTEGIDSELSSSALNNESDIANHTESKNYIHSQNQKQNLSDYDKTVNTIPKNDLPSTISSADSEKEINKAIRQCHEALRNVSSWSILQSLDTPSAYAMNRFSTWMNISQLPMHTNNVTPLKPVPKDKLNVYTNLFNNKNYLELIPQVEQSFSKSPFWLDAHRLVSISLEALGMYEASKQVKEHLGLFLRRFPGLLDLKFSDQSDFADQITTQWINVEVLTDVQSQSNLSTDSNEDNSSYEEVLKDARELAKQQKMKEAIQLFQNNILTQENLRKKTFWKYHLALFCYDNGEYKLSLFLLKEIDGFLVENNLKYWEPELEKNVVYLLIQSFKNSNVSEFLEAEKSTFSNVILESDVPDKVSENREFNLLYSRLCQLDPILALDV